MKKMIMALMAACVLTVSSFAQTTKPTKKAEGTTQQTNTKKEAKTASPTKKDGTADMRFKANKDAAKAQKPAGPVKKDGTPDKRYKANKPATTPAKNQ
ncbi:hypothetical protein HNQ91_005228 [Filimonas zeae]|uniref:Colicin import membrane protein n=1 Tax=Filimonas zeae TaxID=1737353 RepID=A0A917MYB5_9BACT|nr:hypothetical protein [Filimonas zeae]MDR6342151.1 hypothetical protein [Filimonas zeae]GGH78908.1 hypothetical protein GCM10011379_47470 [Filimonas zeae]